MTALRDAFLSLRWDRASDLLDSAPPTSGDLRALLAPKTFYRLLVSSIPADQPKTPPEDGFAARSRCLRSLWLAAPEALSPSELGLARRDGFAALGWLWSLDRGCRTPWASDPADPGSLLATQRAILAVDPLAPSKSVRAPVTAAFAFAVEPYQGLSESFFRPGPAAASALLALDSLGGASALPEAVWDRCLLRALDGVGGFLPEALALREPSRKSLRPLWASWRQRALYALSRSHPDDLPGAASALLRDGSALFRAIPPESFPESQLRDFALDISLALLRPQAVPAWRPSSPDARLPDAALARSAELLAGFLAGNGFAPLIPWDTLRSRVSSERLAPFFAAIEREALASESPSAPPASRRKPSL